MENKHFKQAETLHRQLDRTKHLQNLIGTTGARVVLAVTNAKGSVTLVSESQLREVLGEEFNPIVVTAMEALSKKLATAKSDAETEIELL